MQHVVAERYSVSLGGQIWSPSMWFLEPLSSATQANIDTEMVCLYTRFLSQQYLDSSGEMQEYTSAVTLPKSTSWMYKIGPPKRQLGFQLATLTDGNQELSSGKDSVAEHIVTGHRGKGRSSKWRHSVFFLRLQIFNHASLILPRPRMWNSLGTLSNMPGKRPVYLA